MARTHRRARNPPAPGQIYAFRTAPLFAVSAQETGRYAAFKVIGCSDDLVAVAVLDGVWFARPSLEQAQQTSILKEYRFAHTGRQAVFGARPEEWPLTELREAVLLGEDPASPDERELAAQILAFAPGSNYSSVGLANSAAEGEWRWAHDRLACSAEAEQTRAQQEAVRVAREERHRTRLSKLTWDQLLAETPFKQWSPSPPFPPSTFTAEARSAVHRACKALMALGPKPKKGDVRAILKECVEWFNEADKRAGGVIETEEREDICAVLEELAHVARQRELVEEVDEWRDW
jgi:hypothetical protein